MSEPQKSEEGSARKSKMYFALAGGFLLLMGFVWSLDAFFVYVSLGASLFFFFLGFRNRKVQPKEQRRYERPHQHAGSGQSSRPRASAGPQPATSLFTAFLNEFMKGKTAQAPPSGQPNQSFITIAVTLGFIILVFMTIIISVVFSDSDSVDYSADSYYQTGENFLWEHQYDSAKVYYRRALSIEPEYAEALNGYGNALMGMNQYDSALIMMNKALEVNPDYDYARYSKGLVYYYKQEYRQSRKELMALMENTPDYYDAMVLTGDDYYVEQRNDSALYWYQKAYDNGVRSAGLTRVLAEIQDSKGNREKAIDLYRESLSYDSTNVQIHTRLGELLPGKDGDVFRREGKKWKDAGY